MIGRPKIGEVIACKQCGKSVYSPPSRPRKFCGIACRSAAKLAERVKDGEVRCAKCREFKPVDEFVRGAMGRPHSYCKPCSSEWFHERRGTPPEKRKPYREAYKLSDEQKAQNKRDANRLQHM